MRWNHIMDCQPEDDRWIIQTELDCNGNFDIGIRKYQYMKHFKELVDYSKIHNIDGHYEFWWMYSEDFPFPEKSV